jgi:plasmid maintenance system antidote protein VapI
MDKVKKLVRAGSSIPTAIKEALAQSGFPSVQAFADKHRLVRASVAGHINGTVRASDETVAALAKVLGGSAQEWRELLWQASKPDDVDAPKPAKAAAG